MALRVDGVGRARVASGAAGTLLLCYDDDDAAARTSPEPSMLVSYMRASKALLQDKKAQFSGLRVHIRVCSTLYE